MEIYNKRGFLPSLIFSFFNTKENYKIWIQNWHFDAPLILFSKPMKKVKMKYLQILIEIMIEIKIGSLHSIIIIHFTLGD